MPSSGFWFKGEKEEKKKYKLSFQMEKNELSHLLFFLLIDVFL